MQAALLLSLFLWASCCQVWAAYSVTLAWDASPDSGVTGYYLYYGGTSRSYTNRVEVGNTTTATISDLTPGGTYYFTATAFNAAGLESDYSNEASYTVPSPASSPAITSHPASQTVTAGDSVSFAVTATGTDPLTYQWKKGTTDIPSANSPTLTLTAVTTADAASYSVRVSNSAGSVTSGAATLTVKSLVVAPVIATQPASQTVTAGDNVSFTVRANGTDPLTYQWKKGGTDIPGANSATLTLTAVTSADAASYSVRVSNSTGSVTSAAATLTVKALVIAPVIATQPASQTVTAGDNVSFTVRANGTDPLTYQWKKGATDIPGANSPTLTLTAVTTADAASYSVRVSNSAGSVTSAAATLTIKSSVVAPVITTQPASQTVTAGDNVSFSVRANGTDPLTYQWKKGGTDIPGANNTTLTLTAVTTADAANYSVRVSNSAGSVTSAAATLTVKSSAVAPVITTQPASQTATAGDNVTFTVRANGTDPLTYQWKKGGTDIPGANSATLTLTAVSSPDAANYSVRVSNSAGSVTSAAATLKIQSSATTPVIATQPASQTVTAGDAVTFTVRANGAAPLSYQWYKGNTEIPGANSATLHLIGLAAIDAGGYTVRVSNSLGFVTSASAVLTVQPATEITAAAGSFTGLFSEPEGVAPSSSGSLAIKITATGKFSGKMVLGGVRTSLSGQFDATGRAQKLISSSTQRPVTLDLHISKDEPDRMTGTVSDGTFTANVLADRAGFDGKVKLAPQVGRYTLVIEGNGTGSSTTPRGHGFGTITVNSAGGIRFAATLADATKITQAVPLSKNGDWALFASLYAGQGSLMSWSKFAQKASRDLDGELIWIKPAAPESQLYPVGFSFNTMARGSRYRPEAKAVNFSHGQLALRGGDVGGQILNQIELGEGNRVTNLSSNKLTLTFSAATGLFSGKVVDPASLELIPFRGAVLQKENVAFGWFAGLGGQSGEVILSKETANQ